MGATLQESDVIPNDKLPICLFQLTEQARASAGLRSILRPPVLIRIELPHALIIGKRMLKNASAGPAAEQHKRPRRDTEKAVSARRTRRQFLSAANRAGRLRRRVHGNTGGWGSGSHPCFSWVVSVKRKTGAAASPSPNRFRSRKLTLRIPSRHGWSFISPIRLE